MENLRNRAGEKLEAIHVAAVTAAGNGKSRVQDAFSQTSESIQKISEAFLELWNHELILESRAAISAWSKEAVRRIKEGAPPLSPVLLYEELIALFQDRVWRRTMIVFGCGVLLGGVCGMYVGLQARGAAARGPHARALHAQPDQTVLLVDDHVAAGPGPGEVLVRVQAFTVCGADRRALRGRGAALRRVLRAPPVLVGRAFAGLVLDVGRGVTHLDLGDAVWGTVAEWDGGAATELLTVRSSRVSKRPAGLPADVAAALPWCGTLALKTLDVLRYDRDNCKGKRVAICGAASGEGCVLLQLLAAWGAVVTAAGPHHAANTLKDMGAHEYVECGGAGGWWAGLEQRAARAGPWDAVVACSTLPAPAPRVAALLRAQSPRRCYVELRPAPLWSDLTPAPLHLLFAASFYTYRLLRLMVGCGSHTDWLEEPARLSDALARLAALVDAGHLAAPLALKDKVYLPEEFESALAHACSDDAIGVTVIRFP